MIETDRSMTFLDLQVRVAEDVGQADYATGVAGAASAQNTRTRIKRCLNDAATELSRAIDPKSGESVGWTWMNPRLTLTMSPSAQSGLNLAGDASRYALPRGLVAVANTFAWRAPSGFGGKIRETTADEVVAMHQRSPTLTGSPQFVAMSIAADVPAAIGHRVTREFVFFPKPDLAYTVKFTGRITVQPLVDDAERGPWPPEIDLAIVDRAIALYKRGADDFQMYWDKSVQSFTEAIEFDRQARARGRANNEDEGTAAPVEIYLAGVRIL